MTSGPVAGAAPRVSVIMPMRNAAPFVVAAIRSVLAQETSVAFEIVVVNDGSTDGSEDAVRSVAAPQIRVVQGGGRGEAAAVNLAIENSRGEIVMRCDADDLWPPDRMEWQTAFLAGHPEFCAVAGSMWATDDRGTDRHALGADGASGEITSELLAGATRTSLCAFAVRRDVLVRSGGCRVFFRTAPDIDLQLRLAQFGRVWFEARRCYVYRIHDASVTHTQSVSLRDEYERIARELAAERAVLGTDRLMRGEKIELTGATTGAPASAAEEVVGHLVGAAWKAHEAGDRLRAVALGWKALRRDFLRARSWRSLLALVCKPTRRPLGRRT